MERDQASKFINDLLRLMVSRNGTSFHRYAEAVILTTAPQDRAGNRSNYMAWGLLQLADTPKEWSVYAKEAYYAGPGSRLRRFVYRPDGLVALTAGSDGGEAGDGCIIIYYRKLKPFSAGWLRDNTQKPLLDRLGRRLIV